MSYQVLARKWRPRNFTDLVGQEPVRKVLEYALTKQQLHHAYLFTGTRGVGKTTLARIVAKSLNCEQGITAQPCGTCLTCQEVDRGSYIDLIEVDAASRTKVEDTREILDNVQYAPTRGRYKVYLIDEVHMLSGHSFNALLKTLEEPPPYIVFLLATTDPQRLPATVLSRCLQFHLKCIATELIEARIKFILEQEAVSFELPAISAIAVAAQGSLRDALSLLDQAIAYCSGNIKTQAVREMLGWVEKTCLIQLIQALLAKNANALIEQVNFLAEKAADFDQVLSALLELLQQIALKQAKLDPSSDPNEREKIASLAQNIIPEDVQLYYQIALQGRRDLPYAADPKSGFIMILLRMLSFSLSPNTITTLDPQSAPDNKAQATPSVATLPMLDSTDSNNPWLEILPKLNLTGMTYLLASHCILQQQNDEQIHLLLDPSQAAILNSKHQERLAQALSHYYNKKMQVKISVGAIENETPALQQKRLQTENALAAEKTLLADPQIQAIFNTFDTVSLKSITPL